MDNQKNYLEGLVYELDNNKRMLEQAKHADSKATKEEIVEIEQRIAEVKVELARVSDIAEPRNKIRK